jgi:hypothetical protein
MINYSSINDAWGHKETFKKTTNPISETNVKVEPKKEIVLTETKETKETFITPSSCEMTEHFESCPKCLNKLKEMFSIAPVVSIDNAQYLSDNYIKIFGFVIPKNIIGILFIIIIIIIFMLLLSMVNFPIKQSNIKYNLLPQQFEQMQQMLAMIKNFN